MLADLYSGHLYIWNRLDQSLVKSFEVTDLPVRTSKFVARKQWVVMGSDDMDIRAFNYNTMDKVKSFREAHTDNIRNLRPSRDVGGGHPGERPSHASEA